MIQSKETIIQYLWIPDQKRFGNDGVRAIHIGVAAWRFIVWHADAADCLSTLSRTAGKSMTLHVFIHRRGDREALCACPSMECGKMRFALRLVLQLSDGKHAVSIHQ